MNPIDELRAARPAHLGDAPVDERTRAAELSYAMSRPRPVRRKRRNVRPVWGFSLIGAATAVAVVVSGTGGTTAQAPVPARTTTTSSTPGEALGSGHPADRRREGGPPARRDGRLLAHRVHAANPVRGRGRRLPGHGTAAGGGLDAQRHRWGPVGQHQVARRATGHRRGRGVVETRPAPRQDPGQGAGQATPDDPLDLPPAPRLTGHVPLIDGDKVFWLEPERHHEDRAALPSDPGELKAWPRAHRRAQHRSTERPDALGGTTRWSHRGRGAITDMPVTRRCAGRLPDVAGLDTVDVIENVTTRRTAGYGGRDQAEGQAEGAGQELRRCPGEPADLRPGDRTGPGQRERRGQARRPTRAPSNRALSELEVVLEAGWTDSKPPS